MTNNIISITAVQLRQRLQAGEDIALLDVREAWEHEHFNIGGQLLPLGSIFENVEMIDKEKAVVVYCHKGIRSQIAIQRLQQKYGFTNLINLTGGMEAWERALHLKSPASNHDIE